MGDRKESLLCSTTLSQPVDTAEVVDGSVGREIFVVGTYEYVEESRERRGSLIVIHHTGNHLEELCHHSFPGVLDIKAFVIPINNERYYICACADGSIRVCTIEETSEGEHSEWSVTEIGYIPFEGHGETICLTISNQIREDPNMFVATYTNGYARLFEINGKSNEFHVVSTWKCADAEQWSCLYIDRKHIMTGGDDLILRCWDTSDKDFPFVVYQNKNFEAGVTVLTKLDDKTFMSGSYDETIRIHNIDTGDIVESVKTPGGVWRLCPNMVRQHKWGFLAACMYGGFVLGNIVERSDEYKLSISSVFAEPHDKSKIAYGLTWVNDSSFCSCSFYDKRVALFSIV